MDKSKSFHYEIIISEPAIASQILKIKVFLLALHLSYIHSNSYVECIENIVDAWVFGIDLEIILVNYLRLSIDWFRSSSYKSAISEAATEGDRAVAAYADRLYRLNNWD